MWHPDPDQLALAALPAEQRDRRVDAHLLACPLCHRHVESLRRTVDLALAGGGDVLDDAEMPADRIWRAITDELEIVPSDESAGRTTATVVPMPAGRRRAGWRRLAVPVAATVVGAVVGVAAGVGIGTAVTAPPDGTVVAQLAPIGDLDPGGTGTVRVVERDGGNAMVVRLDGITDTAGGDYLEAWLIDPSGSRLVSLGALAPDGTEFRGEFTVPADLPMGEFGVVDISAEKWDGDESHSRVSLLRGPLA